MEWLLAVALKPFVVLFLFLGIVLPVAWAVGRLMPESKLKRVLFDRELTNKRPWVGWVATLAAFGLIFSWIFWLGGGR